MKLSYTSSPSLLSLILSINAFITLCLSITISISPTFSPIPTLALTCGPVCQLDGFGTVLHVPTIVTTVEVLATTYVTHYTHFPDGSVATSIDTILATPVSIPDPTRIFNGLTLTAPTTYVLYTAFSHTSVSTGTDCVTIPTSIDLGADAVNSNLLVDLNEVPPGSRLPTGVLSYLLSVPTVVAQIGDTNPIDCDPLSDDLFGVQALDIQLSVALDPTSTQNATNTLPGNTGTTTNSTVSQPANEATNSIPLTSVAPPPVTPSSNPAVPPTSSAIVPPTSPVVVPPTSPAGVAPSSPVVVPPSSAAVVPPASTSPGAVPTSAGAAPPASVVPPAGSSSAPGAAAASSQPAASQATAQAVQQSISLGIVSSIGSASRVIAGSTSSVVAGPASSVVAGSVPVSAGSNTPSLSTGNSPAILTTVNGSVILTTPTSSPSIVYSNFATNQFSTISQSVLLGAMMLFIAVM